MNFTEIVREYKISNSQETLNKIFKLLNNVLKTKAKYIYYYKYFPFSLYHKCNYCRKNKNKDCFKFENCTCQKGCFNLFKSELCDYEDVEQDLFLELVRIIKNYDITKDFNSYLYASLWNWYPSFLTYNFLGNIKNKSLYRTAEEYEINLEIADTKENFNIQDILIKCKNEKEKQIITYLYENPGITYNTIAKHFNLSNTRITQIMKQIRNNLS